MAFDWGEFLELARFLAAYRGDAFKPEAGFRCAITRAYYAAFCPAVEYARQRFHFCPAYSGEDHLRLRDCFGAKGMVDVARQLDTLRKWRNQCDYYAETGFDLCLNSDSAIRRAQELLTRLS